MRLGALVVGGVAGAALMYISDPARGRRRRAMARDRMAGMKNRTLRRARRVGQRTGAGVYAAKQKVTHLRPERKELPDDVTFARTIESEVFRDPRVPKGRLNISAENGLVVLRGTLDTPVQIKQFEARVRQVPGVYEIQNLLHIEGTPAPNKQAALVADATGLNQRLPAHATQP
jgi:hypothetical protein